MVVQNHDELYRSAANNDIEQIRVYIDEQKGLGMFKVIFELYEDAEFTKMVTMASPLLTTGEHLRLKVVLTEPIDNAMLQLEDCWATPTPNADDIDAFLMIDQFCPTKLGHVVDIGLIENGASTGLDYNTVYWSKIVWCQSVET